MSLSSHHRGVLGALALAFGAAFAGGHAGGEPKVDPVRAETLTVSRDLPPIPAPALGGTLPALAKPAAHPRRPKRHRADDAAPARTRLTEQRADPGPSSPAATSPPASRPRRRTSPAPSGGGGESGGDSADDGTVTPTVTPAPAPVQVTPAPVEPQPDGEADPEEDAAPEEEAG